MKKKVIERIKEKVLNKTFKYSKEEYHKVLKFYKNYQNFRTIKNCEKETGLSQNKCEFLKKICYKNRALGRYFFEDKANPQKYMKNEILKKTTIDENSYILEIGPGEYPIFDYREYINWIGTDKNYKNNYIDFNGNIWSKNKYPKDRIYTISWENLSDMEKIFPDKKFDLIVGSHSYEHVFRPIQSLIEAASLLKADGYIILFVPDGFSDEADSRNEMTHTLYLTPEMIKEFFHYSKNYYGVEVQTFRPNYDYMVIARKK